MASNLKRNSKAALYNTIVRCTDVQRHVETFLEEWAEYWPEFQTLLDEGFTSGDFFKLTGLGVPDTFCTLLRVYNELFEVTSADVAEYLTEEIFFCVQEVEA
jgi:hypothetical protein